MAEVPGIGAIVEQIRSRIGQIEEQLTQHRDLGDELERLRDALGRLERGVDARVRGRRAQAKTVSPRTTTAAKPTATSKRRRAPAATPRGQTRARIIEALKDGPKTAAEIAQATGIPRASASTTLSKLAKSGDVAKAERGYKLPE